MPGTDIKVTPEILEPIMANATTYQLDLRLPIKNPALSALRPARYETPKSTRKYAAMVIMTASGDNLVYSKSVNNKIIRV